MNVWPLIARGPLPLPFGGCVFTFFCYMVSLVYGAWYEGGWQPTKMVRRYRSRQTSAALFAGCRAVWRQIWPLQCRYARPPFNGAAAVGCFLLSSSLLFSSCMVSNKNRNNTEIAI